MNDEKEIIVKTHSMKAATSLLGQFLKARGAKALDEDLVADELLRLSNSIFHVFRKAGYWKTYTEWERTGRPEDIDK